MREQVIQKELWKASGKPAISCHLILFVIVICLNVFEIKKLQGGTERPSERKI